MVLLYPSPILVLFPLLLPLELLNFLMTYMCLLSLVIYYLSQFCHKNNTTIEFLPSLLRIKEPLNGATLLQGQNNAGVYEWDPNPPKVFTSFKTPIHDWHHGLGHPSDFVLKTLKSSFSLSMSDIVKSHYNINRSHKLPFSNSPLTSNAPLQLIFTDVWSSPF